MSKFCYEKTLGFAQIGFGAGAAISSKGKQWGVSDTIEVAWILGTKEEREAVMKYAQPWFDHANLDVRWGVDMEESDVRISFMKGRGSWSYIGTDCLSIPKHEPTMNFGWDITNDPGTVKHEWGHCLSYKHSQSHFDKDFEFNKEVIYKELAGPPNYWSRRKVDFNVFHTADKHNHYYTDFDRESVMMYTFPKHWLKSGEPTKQNHNLSEKDIEMIKKLYPHTD